jgi:PAS domain S-box-containing protein
MTKNSSINLLGNKEEKIKKPIANVVSRYYVIFISILIIFFTVSIYYYTLFSARNSASSLLMNFVNERGLRESALFLESDDYQAHFQKEYIERYKRADDNELTGWFNEHMEKRIEDGTYRSKPELYYGKDMPLGRRDVSASMMIGAKTEITPEVIKALAIGYDMVNQYGPAWRTPFVDLYFSSPEKTSVSRWPGTPWGLMMNDSVEWRTEEWMAITMKEQNPQREQRWSGVLYDERNRNWMVSGVTPLDVDGKQVGMVGTDLLLDDLVERCNNKTLSGTYNILLQADGRVITHPNMVGEIITSKGMLNAKTSGNEELRHIFHHIVEIDNFPNIIYHSEHESLYGVTRIQGTGWYFVTVYPKKLYAKSAINSAILILILGIVFLIIVSLTNWFVLKRIIVNPITLLTKIVKNYKVSSSQDTSQIEEFNNLNPEFLTRQDEIGLLINSFLKLSKHLQTTIYELEQSEARFSAISNQSSEGITVADMDGNYIYVNPAFCKMSGFSEEELLKMTVFDMKAKSQPHKSFYDSKEKMEGLPIRVDLQRKDKTEYLTEIVGKVININNNDLVLGTIRDITESVQAEEALKESEELLLKIAENYPNSYLSIIDKDFRIGFTSGKEFKIQNLNPSDFVGLQAEMIFGDQWENIRAYFEKTFAGKEQSFELYINNQYQLYNTIPLINEDGSIHKILSVAENITVRKLAEKELLEHRNQLEEIVKRRTRIIEKQKIEVEEANRLKSEFLSNMSHELRTPLNSIMALSNVLITKAKNKLDDDENNYLQVIERNGQRLLVLINDILDLSKIEAGKMDVSHEFTSIGNLLLIIKENMQTIADKKELVLTLSIPDNLPQIDTDESKLHQVLLNMVSNAIKFTEEGEVSISANYDTNNVFIEIKDTGIGISKEMLPNIFDEFRQVDGTSTRQYEGTGLGLAIANKLVKLLSGNIEVKSELNEGSVFTITIPIKWK